MDRLRLPVVCVLTALAAILIHETGHALAGYLAGNRVAEVVLFSVRPHVILEGPSTPGQTAFKAIAGTGLFLLAWLLFVVLAPKGGAVTRTMVAAASLVAFVEAFGWTLSALLHPYGPRSEDGWKFVTHSGVPPILIALAALAVACYAWRIFYFGRSVPTPVVPVAPENA